MKVVLIMIYVRPLLASLQQFHVNYYTSTQLHAYMIFMHNKKYKFKNEVGYHAKVGFPTELYCYSYYCSSLVSLLFYRLDS